ncbi:unnamed protein product, partial [Cuscuta europaea]
MNWSNVLQASAGSLQPLPIPEAIWSNVSMDFIEGLPKSQGKDTILVGVDRLSKYAHFILLTHPFSTNTVAKAYMDNVFKLHGIPKTIVCDRDKIFCQDLLLSTAYHPQTDGQTEIVNKGLETYLRCMTGENPKEWAAWIPLAEWWYNTNYHSAIGKTPYEVVYGQPLDIHY